VGYGRDNLDQYDDPSEQRQGPPLTSNFMPAKHRALTNNGRPVIKYTEAGLMAAAAAMKQNKPETVEPPPKLIPEWFDVLESTNAVHLRATTKEKRFDELLNKLWSCEREMRLAKSSLAKDPADAQDAFGSAKPQGEGNAAGKQPWNRNYHDANPGWPTMSGRKYGGWWLCRSDPGVATAAELACGVCHAGASSQTNKPPSKPTLNEIRAEHAYITEQINRSMASVGVRDRALALAKLRGERADAVEGTTFRIFPFHFERARDKDECLCLGLQPLP
jgi:hypothetical protein